uniref:Uncharacterized protein n=1 Tax=Tetranychus urticae TaxID=32264 RepID=T1L3R3_TETUR
MCNLAKRFLKDWMDRIKLDFFYFKSKDKLNELEEIWAALLKTKIQTQTAHQVTWAT